MLLHDRNTIAAELNHILFNPNGTLRVKYRCQIYTKLHLRVLNKFTPFMRIGWRPKTHQCCRPKFGENPYNMFQDIALRSDHK